MKQIVAGLVAFCTLSAVVPSLAEAAGYSGWTIRRSGSSVSSSAYFSRFSIHSSSWESETNVVAYSGSLLRRPEPVELPANDCGPRSFQVLNAGQNEPSCIGLGRK
jgi:hypothetical protein